MGEIKAKVSVEALVPLGIHKDLILSINQLFVIVSRLKGPKIEIYAFKFNGLIISHMLQFVNLFQKLNTKRLFCSFTLFVLIHVTVNRAVVGAIRVS